jgi:HD-GYP domain-containing protein (c-di-GMP phosphodiesterase class II)
VEADLVKKAWPAPVERVLLDEGIHSYLNIPLIVAGELIGSLNLGLFSPGTPSAELLQFAREIADSLAIAIQNARLVESERCRLERVSSLHTIDMAITGTRDLEVVFDVILKQAVDQLGVDAAAILLVDQEITSLTVQAAKGFRSDVLHARLGLGEGIIGRAVTEKQEVYLRGLPETGGPSLGGPLLVGEEFSACAAVPIAAGEQVRGVLAVFHRSQLDQDSEWLSFQEALATQAAISIDNARLFESLVHLNQELTLAYDITIEGLSHALDLRDHETEGHSQRVTDLTGRLVSRMGVSEDQQVHIRRGALLHDIGKVGIPDAVLQKPASLSAEEWTVMRRHPVLAYELLAPIAFLRPALDIPYCHHEKWDGSGYPRGLAGEAIPLTARIFAIVDVWDALLSDRPYRAAWPEGRVRAYLRTQAGIHFDPRVVDLFFKVLDRKA